MSLGIDPGQMVFETVAAPRAILPHAACLLLLTIYFSYDWIVEGSRSRKFLCRGRGGVAAIVLAFLAGFFVFTWDRAAIMLRLRAGLVGATLR